MIEAVKNTSVFSGKWKTSEWGNSPLVLFAQQFYPLSSGAVDCINQNTFLHRVAKGKHIVKAGDICGHLYFIKRGVMRAYFKEGGKDISTWICTENEIVTSIRGFHLQEPSIENIQAIEDCELLVAPYDCLQYLYTNFMEMNIIGRRILEQYYIDAEERAYIARLAKASARYQYFMQTRGDLANRIPLKFIASYLGMTIETLSRMRSRLLQAID